MGVEALYDLLNGRYIASGMRNEERGGLEFGFEALAAEYTPPRCAMPASAEGEPDMSLNKKWRLGLGIAAAVLGAWVWLATT